MAVMQAHTFHARLEWTGAEQGPTKDIKSYSREYEIAFADKHVIPGSAAPGFLGDASRVNPEEMFAASLAACQLLTYLAFAARAGVQVTAYRDEAVATVSPIEGKWQVTKVTLRPRVTIAAGSDAAKAQALVEQAHEGCFIARSVKCEVTAEPEIVTA